MKNSQSSPDFYGALDQAFRERVHELLAWGYEDALATIRTSSIQGAREEPAITGFIARAMKVRIRATKRPFWAIYMDVHEEQPQESPGKVGKSRPRTDIVVTWELNRKPEFVIEAKRLRDPGFGTGKYVGGEGMGCFICGSYAGRYVEAAMLGYVQSGTVGRWREKVQKAITENAGPLRLKSAQRDVRVHAAFPLEWTSEHERESDGRVITIYHILLDCCPR